MEEKKLQCLYTSGLWFSAIETKGIDDSEKDQRNIMSLHFVILIINNRKRAEIGICIWNSRFRKVCCVVYRYWCTLYIKKLLSILDERRSDKEGMGQAWNDNGDGGLFYVLFIEPKVEIC